MYNEISRLVESLHQLERAILPFLKDNINLAQLIEESNLTQVEVMRALQWLENKKALTLSPHNQEIISLDKNGKIYLKSGLPEKIFLESLTKPLTLQEIKEKTNLNQDEINISIGILKKQLAITFSNNKILITDQGKRLIKKIQQEESFLEKLPININELSEQDRTIYNNLKSRNKIIKLDLIKDRKITLTELGKKLITIKIDSKNIIDSLKKEIILNKSWQNKKFRRYDIKINVPHIYPGKRHFVNQAIEYIKRIWLDLGFKEMQGKILDTSFWNFDALFTPQDHPAREMQDTFFIDGYGKLPYQRLVNNVKKEHEHNWHYKWQENKARDLVLRTHTTILSAKTLATLKHSELPAKLFSVGKVFRNEALDWKHLFELTQVEGIVVDENANLKHLIGYLKQYYSKLGYQKIRVRPSYFPYTEPSLEIEVYHPIRKTWIELGGAGIFRPEVTRPLLGKEIPVLAWGQGLERGISEYFNILDIRDLYKNDLKQLREMKIFLK